MRLGVVDFMVESGIDRAGRRVVPVQFRQFAPKGKSFAEALSTMPNVGQDKDFERVEDDVKNEHVFS